MTKEELSKLIKESAEKKPPVSGGICSAASPPKWRTFILPVRS